MPHSIAVRDGRVFTAHGSTITAGLFPEIETTIKIPLRDLPDTKDRKFNYVDRLYVSPCGTYLVAIDHFAKALVVYDAVTLAEKSFRVFPKRPSALAFIENDVLVADKFGDVYRVPLESTEPIIRDNGACSIEPILGHISMLLDIDAVPGHVFTADRDEHIRVSRLPDAYIIDRFLFGHTQYVARLAVIGEYLVSGGGDDFLLCWDWNTGVIRARCNLRELDGVNSFGSVDVTDIVSYESSVLVLVEGQARVFSLDVATLKELDSSYQASEKITSIAVDGHYLYMALPSSVEKIDLITGDRSLLNGIFEHSDVALFTQHELRKQPQH